MNGKENIINKILADADNKCAEILAAAESQAEEISANAQEHVVKEKDALDKRLENIAAERRRNSFANAQLESRKYKLMQKQQLISACYQKALQEMLSLPASSKVKFLTKLIQNYAEVGETVYCAKADKDIVTQQFLDGFNKRLKLGGIMDASGGLYLEGVGYDKDLTLEKIVAYAREATEGKVATTLFGEKR